MNAGVVKLALKGEEELNHAEFNNGNDLNGLISRCCNGDTLAMEAIYNRYKMPLFNLAYRMSYDRSVAEDLLHEIFIKVFENMRDLRKAEAFRTWLYRIAANTCISYLRVWKKRYQKLIPLTEVEWKLKKESLNEDDTILKNYLDEAINTLPNRLKSIFVLHDVQGFKHKEISKILGCAEGTSKSQLFKARKKIRQHLIKLKLI